MWAITPTSLLKKTWPIHQSLRSILWRVLLPSLVFIKNICRSSPSQMFFKTVLCNVHRKTLVLESLFNKVAGLQVFSCEYCKIVKSSFFIEHLRWLLLQMFCLTLYFQKDVAEYIVVLHCIIVSFWNLKSLSFAFIRCTTRRHLWYYSLSLVVICCTTRSHSLSLVVILCHSLYHSLSLVVTWCTTRLSFYKRS